MDEARAPIPPPTLTARGILLLIAAHLALATAETACIVAEVSEYRSVSGELFVRALLDAACKVLVTLPIWWLVVRRMDGRPWPTRLAAHAVALPTFLFAWHVLYHGAVGSFGLVPVHAASMPWDYFYGTIVYTAQFAVMHVVRQQRLAREREELTAELRHLAAQAELRALRAQVMPHFLFNTLHALSASVPAEHQELRRRIALLGGLLRYTLNTTEQERVTLGDELQFARDYLALEKIRLGERLAITYDVDEDALGTLVPPVVLQPLVENALKHGVANRRAGGEVALIIERQNGNAIVRVRDHAEGERDEAALSSGVGLRNVEARLAGMGNGARLRTQPLPDGFEAELIVPVTP